MFFAGHWEDRFGEPPRNAARKGEARLSNVGSPLDELPSDWHTEMSALS